MWQLRMVAPDRMASTCGRTPLLPLSPPCPLLALLHPPSSSRPPPFVLLPLPSLPRLSVLALSISLLCLGDSLSPVMRRFTQKVVFVLVLREDGDGCLSSRSGFHSSSISGVSCDIGRSLRVWVWVFGQYRIPRVSEGLVRDGEEEKWRVTGVM